MQVQQERDRVLGRPIVWITSGVLVATAAFVFLAALILATEVEDSQSVARTQGFEDEINQMELTLIERRAPGPELEDIKLRRLETFGWLNEDAGMLHIPIGVAMDLYLRERAAQGRGPAAPALNPRTSDAGSEATGRAVQETESDARAPRGQEAP